MKRITTIGFGMEEDLSVFIEKFLYDDFKKRNIGLYEKQCGPGLGMMMTFKSSDMLINIINEKSVFEITIAAINDRKESWDIYLIQSHLYFKGHSDTKTKEERKGLLVFEWSIEQSTKFLLENFDEINESFNERNYTETKGQLKIIQKERSKYMWGEN